MARSNWSGSGGWSTINDPTGLLNGRVLVATAGITAVNEDYLLQVVGTTLAGTTFTFSDYEVCLDYAWSAGAQATIFSSGVLGLIARAGSYSLVSGVSVAQSCYIGRLNYQQAKAQIIKRTSGTDTIMADADIPTTADSKGQKHTARFVCRGSDPVTLQLYIDNNLTVNIGDNSSTIITTGQSGIQAGNGTVYVDNFAVKAYGDTVSGYSGNLPNTWFDSNADPLATGTTFMVLWFSSDHGVTVATRKVSEWRDRAGRIAGGYPIDNPTTDKQPTFNAGSLNGLGTIRFNHTSDTNLKGGINSALDIQANGVDDGITAFFVVRFYKSDIGDVTVAGGTDRRASLTNYGRAWNLYSDWDTSDDNPLRTLAFDNVSNNTSQSDMYSVGDWAILMYSSGNTTTLRGFWKNGTQEAVATSYPPSNFDMDDASRCFYMGRRPFAHADEATAYGSFDIAEVIITNTESAGIPQDMRQKTEGYLAHKWGLTSLLPVSHPYKTLTP